MAITAGLVKELRDLSGSGMMECKQALVEANGDLKLAHENLRKKGRAKADKKASNLTGEGCIVIGITPDHKRAVMIEVNCQTDFVARDESFKEFAEHVAQRTLAESTVAADHISDLAVTESATETLEERRQSLVAKLGENLQIRRAKILDSSAYISTYLHGDRIGVLVELSIADAALGKDLAMHIAASRPRAIASEDIPVAVIEKEREIFFAQAQGSGKPMDIIKKMVEGRIKKFTSEECLLGQPFVKDPSITVSDLLTSKNAQVLSFECFKVGEGMEKKAENFADEVMAQVRGSK